MGHQAMEHREWQETLDHAVETAHQADGGKGFPVAVTLFQVVIALSAMAVLVWGLELWLRTLKSILSKVVQDPVGSKAMQVGVSSIRITSGISVAAQLNGGALILNIPLDQPVAAGDLQNAIEHVL